MTSIYGTLLIVTAEETKKKYWSIFDKSSIKLDMQSFHCAESKFV